MEFVTLSIFSKMLLLGSKRIIENRKKIDAINIFPVADSDTGSNLANTFLGLGQILESKSFANSNKLVGKVIESVFANSRGNSGIMMASYLKGFLTSLKEKDKFFLEDFAKASKTGQDSARSSIQKPVSGAMLDVMEAFSSSLATKEVNGSFTDAFYKATQKAKSALLGTKKKLKVLEANNVVDAGALGFTFFVYGFYEGLSDKSLELTGINIKPKVSNKEGDIGKFPHEVVFTVRNTLFKVEQIREILSPMGDCLEIIEMEEKVKIHIHTDKPEVVRETASLAGKVVDIRIMDMRLEKKLNHES
ncbi:MAG: DAK2 domain-containing protein [Patescibacteria group bacterium]